MDFLNHGILRRDRQNEGSMAPNFIDAWTPRDCRSRAAVSYRLTLSRDSAQISFPLVVGDAERSLSAGRNSEASKKGLEISRRSCEFSQGREHEKERSRWMALAFDRARPCWLKLIVADGYDTEKRRTYLRTCPS